MDAVKMYRPVNITVLEEKNKEEVEKFLFKHRMDILTTGYVSKVLFKTSKINPLKFLFITEFPDIKSQEAYDDMDNGPRPQLQKDFKSTLLPEGKEPLVTVEPYEEFHF